MPKKIIVGNAILADYVAEGKNNKTTIVNAFSGKVILSEIPAQAGFGIYLELRFGEEAPPNGLLFEILFNGESLIRGNAVGVASPGDPATIVIPHFRVAVENEGQLEVYVSAEGFKRTLVLQKEIIKGAIPRGETIA